MVIHACFSHFSRLYAKATAMICPEPTCRLSLDEHAVEEILGSLPSHRILPVLTGQGGQGADSGLWSLLAASCQLAIFRLHHATTLVSWQNMTDVSAPCETSKEKRPVPNLCAWQLQEMWMLLGTLPGASVEVCGPGWQLAMKSQSFRFQMFHHVWKILKVLPIVLVTSWVLWRTHGLKHTWSPTDTFRGSQVSGARMWQGCGAWPECWTDRQLLGGSRGRPTLGDAGDRDSTVFLVPQLI